MYTISNNGFITITRGDSFQSPLFINQGTSCVPIRWCIERYPNAKVYLGIMEYNQPFEQALIRKQYQFDYKKDKKTGESLLNDFGDKINKYGDIVVTIRSQDTEYLLPGKYYYEVKIDYGNGKIDTAIPKTEFFILE